MKSVNKGLKVRLYPDEDMIKKINQNTGNARFVWNRLLEEYIKTYKLFLHHGYTKLKCNMVTFNTMLNMLKKENEFLSLSESTSLQQVYRDLINAFNKFFKEKRGHPRFKTKKNPKQSFRIQNNNTIKIKHNTIKFPKIGKIHYRASPEYKKQLKIGKINNVTIKKDHDKYYAIFNIEIKIIGYPPTFKNVGIDLGVRTLVTLSNKLKINNLDLTKENKMIKKYQKILSRKKYQSKHYQKTLKRYWKWVERKKNKIFDSYHKLSHHIVKNYDIICMENLNIQEMFQDSSISTKLQSISLNKLVKMIKYKSEWYGKIFIQIGRWYPSSKKCNNCGYYNKNLKRNDMKWICPECGKIHDRDINAAKNILKEGTNIFNNQTRMNLRNWGDSTVNLLSWESTSP